MTGKIIRAKPRYIKQDYFRKIDEENLVDENELFFNLGRAGLKLLLLSYSKYLNREITVGMQSFNCRVVADAAIESNCKILLFDIKLNDFSISIDSLKRCKVKIDVLLLTHYQGIPNEQYEQIAKFCRETDILLIDDISQTENSKINNIEAGSLGDFAIKSFAFDKPFSTLEGGSIIINNSVSNELKEILLNEYNIVPLQNRKKTKNDLKILKFLLEYSEPEFYHNGLNNVPALRLYSQFLRLKTIYRFSFFVKLNSYIRELLKRKNQNKPIRISKLRKDKISLLMLQRFNKIENVNIDQLVKISIKLGLKPISNINSKIYWNRYSIIDKNNILKNYLNSKNIEAGNYNWPVPLHLLFSENKRFIIKGDYSNSEFCSQNILNIPIWRELKFNDNEL